MERMSHQPIIPYSKQLSPFKRYTDGGTPQALRESSLKDSRSDTKLRGHSCNSNVSQRRPSVLDGETRSGNFLLEHNKNLQAQNTEYKKALNDMVERHHQEMMQ